MTRKRLASYIDTLEMSIYSSFQQKGSFFTELSLIGLNNFFFIALWWLFFQRFDSIAGWYLSDILTMMSIVFGAFGLKEIFFGGLQTLSFLIESKQIERYLMLPGSPLLHIAASRSFPKGWGHFLTAISLLCFGGFASLSTLPLLALFITTGCIIFTSISVILYSLPFWLHSVDNASKRYYENLLLFALYPAHTYGGILKIALFSVIPAGTIGTLPVELLQEFSLNKLLFLLGSAAFFLFLARLVFQKGLKAYKGGTFAKFPQPS